MNDFYLRVMRCMEDNNESLWWRTADAERITEANIGILEQAIKDCDEPLLFCARVRRMRPQGAMYKYIKMEHRHFFDACGPERELDSGNPKEPVEYWMDVRIREAEEEQKKKENPEKKSIWTSIYSAFSKLFIVFLLASAALNAQQAHFRNDNGAVLNDLTVTPGAVGTMTTAQLCDKSFHTGTVRNVTESTKIKSCAEYGIAKENCNGKNYEIDHLISLELGGINDIKNLWPEAYAGQYS
jgi:hypothetical protein